MAPRPPLVGDTEEIFCFEEKLDTTIGQTNPIATKLVLNLISRISFPYINFYDKN